MEDLDLSHVLTRVRAILKNCTRVTEQAAVAARSTQSTSKETDAPLRYFRCDGPNHRASDCLLGRETFSGAGALKNRHVLSMSAAWAHCSILPGKRARRRGLSANIHPPKSCKWRTNLRQFRYRILFCPLTLLHS